MKSRIAPTIDWRRYLKHKKSRYQNNADVTFKGIVEQIHRDRDGVLGGGSFNSVNFNSLNPKRYHVMVCTVITAESDWDAVTCYRAP